jgi:hypothetical protein
MQLSMPKTVSFQDLQESDLIVDAVYEGEAGGHLSGEPLGTLLPGMGNQGGFRSAGTGDDKKCVTLYTTGEDRDWPDSIDLSTGQFTYYGDNKRPGHELHETVRGGNRILRRTFELLHGRPEDRSKIPPFLVFQKYPTVISSRSAQFKGIAVPGFRGIPATSDLVAVWKSTDGNRFQNYRAIFTILDVPTISRSWLKDLADGHPMTSNAPRAWADFSRAGVYKALTAAPTTIIRSTSAQLPDTSNRIEILKSVWLHFKDSPFAFEAFAARLFQMQDPRVIVDELTRPTADGGRDAIGRYRLGLRDDPVYAEFSLEAKCYSPGLQNSTPNTVGVKEVSRLISRIKHREFGVLVTTSVVARQAYEEVRGDRHPIIFICGKDIVDILVSNGFNSTQAVNDLLHGEFFIEERGGV